MVLASMVGSSASNEYGKGGTVNATGLSSTFRLRLKSDLVSACNRLGAALPAPSRPAPTMPLRTRNLRRSMGTPQLRWALPLARGIIAPPAVAAQPSGSSPPAKPRHWHCSLLDAPQGPSGRFRDCEFRRARQPLQKRKNAPAFGTIRRKLSISQRNAGVAHQPFPLRAFDRAPAEDLAKFCLAHSRKPFQTRFQERLARE